MAEDTRDFLPGDLPDPRDAATTPYRHEPSDADAETSGDVAAEPVKAPVPFVMPEVRPDRIEGYRLMGQIGRGGMGTVYLAQRLDDRFRKRVAIKVMRRGMDTEEMLERFQLERQVLGALNHPNIARLFDAGATEDGRPFFVMEHVEGRPIDVYCDEQNLSVPERVRLFTKVCAAVHYAHQNLIVHRDLKPSNILVTADGEPKLLDFGIAKLLNPELLGLPALTRADQRIMTYEYASPEQVQGQSITTASDVYALGVILYELLTGHRPYQITRRAHAEAVRVICEEEPERPSTAVSRAATRRTGDGEMHTITAAEIAKRREAQLTRLKRNLAGDLDNVVLMAMRKSASRRYPTAQALADDLVRHLDGQTVTARPPTLGYRAGKFIRRHRVGVAAAALVLVSLVVGVIGVSWAWQRAEGALSREHVALVAATAAEAAERDARVAAETRYQQLRRMFTIEDSLYAQIDNLPGSTAARDILSNAMLTAIGSLSASFPDDTRLRRDLAVQYRRIGVLAAGGENSVARGVEALEKARELLADAEPTDEEHFRVGVELARALWRSGDRDGAVRVAVETADRCAAIAGDPAAPRGLPVWHARALTEAAIVRVFHSRLDEAAELLTAAVGLASEAVEANPDDADAVLALAQAHEQFGEMHRKRGLAEERLAAHRIALPLFQRAVDLTPASADARRRLVMSHERVGRALLDLGRHDEAASHLEAMRTLAQAEADADPFSGRALADVARSFENASDLAAAQQQWDAADQFARAYLTASLELLDRDPLDLNSRRRVGLAHYKLGYLHFDQARTVRRENPALAAELYPRAAAELESALTEFRVLSEADPNDTELRGDVLRTLRFLGYSHYWSGDAGRDPARIAFEQALTEAAAIVDGGEVTPTVRDHVMHVAGTLCNMAYEAGRPERIAAATETAFAVLAERPAKLVGQLARGVALTGDFRGALALIAEAKRPYETLADPESDGFFRQLVSLEAEYRRQAEGAGPDLDEPGP